MTKFKNLNIWLLLVLAIVFVFPTNLYAQDQTCDIKWRDAKSASRDAIQSAAANISTDAQTIILFGGNREIWDQIIEGACQQAQNSRTRLNGIILAAPEESQGAPEIQFFAHSQLTATILRANRNGLSDIIADQLDSDFQQYFSE